MQLTYRYRVKDAKSRRVLQRMANCVNMVWNYCNDAQRHAVRWGQKWPSGFDLNRLTAGASKEIGLGAQTLQAIGQQYAISRQAQRKRRLRYRGKRTLGWVPFKALGIRHESDAFRFMGHSFRVWLSRPVNGAIRCGSFAQDAMGHWYINLVCEVAEHAACGQGMVGIDLGLKTTASMSDGSKYDGLRAYRAIEPKLAVAQRAHKKKRAQALHAKAKNRRLDGLHKLSTKLVSQNKLVAVGNVNSLALVKTRMAKSTLDAGWGLLRTMLRYKTLARGAAYRDVDEHYSSQMCSACGSLPKSRPKGIAQLGIREWTCSDCGTGHDRDVNAARNILALGCQRLAEGIPVL
jgi:putative transposase